MCCSSQRFNEKSFCASVYVPHDFDRLVVRTVHLLGFLTKQVPKYTTGEMCIPNGIYLEFRARMSEIKFLNYLIIFPNVPRSLVLHILRHDVPVGDYPVTDMQTRLLPWKKISTKLHSTIQRTLFPEEGKSSSFTFPRIRIRREFQVMAGSIFFASFQHLLKSIQRWSKKQIIITVTTYSEIVTVYPAT